jgi:hypothetical protein
MKISLASMLRPLLSRAASWNRIENARHLKNEAEWIAISSLMFALGFGYKVLFHLSEVSLLNDWDYHLQLRWVAFYTIYHFHQLPLWNPYRCGGMPMLGHPQSAFISPFLPLDFMFGPMVSIHLQIVLHLAIAFGGGCFLARELGMSKLGAIAAAGCFAGSSRYYIHMAAGHPDFMPYKYVPWVIGLFYLSVLRRRLTYAALSGLVMSLMYFAAGIYAVPQTALILALLAATLSLQHRSVYPLLVLALIGASTTGFAAVKLLPTLSFFGPGGRPIDPGEANHLWMFVPALFSRNQWGGQILGRLPWGFHEYGAYIGAIFGLLGVWGIVLFPRRGLPWLVAGIATLSLAMGYFGTYSPWAVIHKLPPFYSERIPSRFLILFTLAAGMLAGLGVDALGEVAEPWGMAAALMLVTLALIDGWLVSASYLHEAVSGGESPKPSSATFTQLSDPRTGGHAMYMASNANTGVIACNDSIPHKFNVRGIEDPTYRSEQYLLGDGTVTLTRWTPNALSFGVDVLSPTVLVVNQNYDQSWRVIDGRGEVFSESGLIAVRMPAGRQNLTIAFCSRAFLLGLALSFFTVLAMLGIWWSERPRLDGSFVG